MGWGKLTHSTQPERSGLAFVNDGRRCIAADHPALAIDQTLLERSRALPLHFRRTGFNDAPVKCVPLLAIVKIDVVLAVG